MITDIDGNNYKTVKIGKQEWMSENLNVSHYRKGDVIPEVQDAEEWNKLTTGAWCYYENDTENGKIYGKLYNWYAVNDPRGLAPEGWHIPTDAEWIELTDYLGGEEVAGGKVKATERWKSPNEGATNETGFTAFSGGHRIYDGDFEFIGESGYFWSSSEDLNDHAWNRFLNYFFSGVYRFNFNKIYGFSIRCVREIEASENKIIDYGIVTDIDGNTYKTVKIGKQEWMSENLNVSHYRKGDVIPEVQDAEEWNKLTTGAWCYYENDTENGKIYGKLYNWYAVNDPRGLAPEGWHIPTDAEWIELTDYLGGEEVAGGKLKATERWLSTNEGATNETGFTAFPGGGRYNYGVFGIIGMYGYFWSASESNNYFAWNRLLDNDNSDVYRNYYIKENGFSVRCVRESKASENKNIDHGIVTYIDGNNYKTVKIGNQEWMSENLNLSHYRNGDEIPEVKDYKEWEKLTTGAWCYYENNTENGKIYSKLYNWYAVNDPRGLAPEGWHIPSDEEWTELIDYLGGRGAAGGKLKATEKWESPNEGAKNETGFTAFPGGYRLSIGVFLYVGNIGIFWTASENNDDRAWYRSMLYLNSVVDRYDYNKSCGFSIRCVRD